MSFGHVAFSLSMSICDKSRSLLNHDVTAADWWRAHDSVTIEPEDFLDGDSLASEVRTVQLVETYKATSGEMALDRFQALRGRFIEVKVKICTAMIVSGLSSKYCCIVTVASLSSARTSRYAHGTFLLMILEYSLEIALVAQSY